jgi:hypothetical protein
VFGQQVVEENKQTWEGGNNRRLEKSTQEDALFVVIFSRIVGGGKEEDGCVCQCIENSWEIYEIKKYSNILKTEYKL